MLPLVNILLIISCSSWNSNYLTNMEVVRINAGICIYNVLYAHPILICDPIKCITLLNHIGYHEIITSESGYELIAVSVIDAVQAGRHMKAGKTPYNYKILIMQKRIDLRLRMLYTICRISVRH